MPRVGSRRRDGAAPARQTALSPDLRASGTPGAFEAHCRPRACRSSAKWTPERVRHLLSIRHASFHEDTQQTAAAVRGRIDRRRQAPVDERQGSDGVRRALRRRDALRKGLQGSGQAQLPAGGRLHREPQDEEHAAGASDGQGHALGAAGAVDLGIVLQEIEDARLEDVARRSRQQGVT